MGGYLLNLFKSPPADVKNIKSVEQLKNQVQEGDQSLVRNVVWSNFDRIEIRRIDCFKRFRNASRSEKEWIGERQFALLYDLVEEANSRLLYRGENHQEDKCRFRFEATEMNSDLEEGKQYRFFGISMVNFSPIMHQYFFDNKDHGKIVNGHLKFKCFWS